MGRDERSSRETKARQAERRREIKLVGTRRVTDAAHQLPRAPEPSTTGAGSAGSGPIAAQTRYRRICERAYQIAAKRGFGPGKEVDDWLQAEREIDSEALTNTFA
jgi:Protein of unknown function (DUF2934)